MKEKSKELDGKEYLDKLLNDAGSIPVDDSPDYEIEVPPFYNEAKFKRAQDFFAENRFACFTNMLTGLLGLLAVPTIFNVLVATDKSSNVLKGYRRYMATIFHTINWFRYELKPGTECWRSIATVRRIHFHSSKKTEKMGVGIISQKDMALTQFAFMGFFVLKTKELGVQYKESDLDAFCHFWRVLGYMLGIKDEYNICDDSFASSQPRLEAIRTQIYRPYIQQTKEDFIKMTKDLIEGFWCFNPNLEYDSFMYWVKYLTGLEEYSYWEPSGQKNIQSMGWYSRAILYLLVVVHCVLINYWIFRVYYNFQILYSEFLIKYFPFLAFYKFGVRPSYVKI
uniref:CSON014639 protein n=1 Tax=Culicoides sonorensis TaxID=179676 RepID=A0A336KRV0_CULSO